MEASILREIYKLKKTLLTLDTDDRDPTVCLQKHTQKIQDSIPSDRIVRVSQLATPIHQLLKVGPLKRIEIPLDILELLTSAGFDVNYSDYGETCLNTAIKYNHYKAVRWLVEHGADCNGSDCHFALKYHYASPIVELSRQPNAPLDIFDLLKTRKNLNSGHHYLPLHEALKYHNTDSALHLIQLGSKIEVNDEHHNKPIDYYVDKYFDEFHEELFLKLIPHDSMTLVSEIGKILKDPYQRRNFEVMSQMVRYLLQYLIMTDLDEISLDCLENHRRWFQFTFFMDSLLVLLLDRDLVEVQDIATIKSMLTEMTLKPLEDIWNAYNHRHGNVKSLVTLSIHSVRNSMNSLDDKSFHSLPIPSRIRDLLMLRNVACILCEARCIWPKCLPIEDIVNEAL